MTAAAVVLLLLGLLGLILPFVPGIPLLVVAALLFAANAPGLRRRLLASPKLAWLGRWRQRLAGRRQQR